MTEPQFDFRPILHELDTATAELRQALRDAIERVLPEGTPLSSRSCAEALGIDKTLGWSCMRIATIADVGAILGSLPGRPGWSKVMRGLRQAKCPPSSIEAADAAFKGVYERIGARGLDRKAIRAIAAGRLDAARHRDNEARIRRQQHESARLVWGVSRQATLAAHLVAPARKDASSVDLASVVIASDLQRHRLGPPWNIFASVYTYAVPSASAATPILGEPLDPGSGCPLMPEFTSPGAFGSELLGGWSGGRWLCDFADRSPSRHRPLQVAFGEVSRCIGGRWQSPGEPPVALALPAGMPTATSIFDVMLHREIVTSTSPFAALYATIVHDPSRREWPDRTRLPMATETTVVPGPALPASLRAVAAPYRRLLTLAAAALDSELDEFVVHRTVVEHQPIPTTTVVRFNLASRPVE